MDNVNWRIGRGEHWVILGANGSGKTSLPVAISGYLMPTSGEIFLLCQHFGYGDWCELRKQVDIVKSSVRQMMADE